MFREDVFLIESAKSVVYRICILLLNFSVYFKLPCFLIVVYWSIGVNLYIGSENIWEQMDWDSESGLGQVINSS